MAKTPKGARVVGAVAVRAVPDTSKFVEDLKRELREMVEQEINVDAKIKPELNRAQFEAIKKQLQELAGTLKIDARLSGIKSDIKELRENIRTQIEKALDGVKIEGLTFDVKATEESIQKTRQDLRSIIDDFDGEKIALEANANTLAASAQIRYTTRPRVVDIVLKVNEASIAAVGTTIAALSGARLITSYGEDLWDFFKDLDKNLPKLATMTTAIVGLTGALFGSVSALASFGAGLAQIFPLLLVLPGLIMGFIASAVVIGSAWADVDTVLGDLSDSFANLQDIMSDSYWGEAAQPIRDMVNGLMPQMEVAMAGVSRALGGFTGALAASFEKELGGGRLEAIFGSMEEGFRIMEQGTDGFAGAIVNLALIAGRYFPRLAQWITDIAGRFDQWLTDISTDGRLDQWIDQGVRSLTDLWMGLMALGQVFKGIWTAAESAGATAMAGFRQEMEDWARVVNSPDSQRAMEDWFRGGRELLKSLGVVIDGFFSAIGDESTLFMALMTEVGLAIEAIGEAFNTIIGNESFLAGLIEMFDGFQQAALDLVPAMEPLGDFLGTTAGFIGHLAEELAGPLSSAIETVLPRIEEILLAAEPVVSRLADGLQNIIESESFQNILGIIEEAIVSALETVDRIIPSIETGVQNVIDLINTFAPILEGFGPLAEGILIGIAAIILLIGQAAKGFAMFIDYGIPAIAAGINWLSEVIAAFFESIRTGSIFTGGFQEALENINLEYGPIFEGLSEAATTAAEESNEEFNTRWAELVAAAGDVENPLTGLTPNAETEARAAAEAAALQMEAWDDYIVPGNPLEGVTEAVAEEARLAAEAARSSFVGGGGEFGAVGEQVGGELVVGVGQGGAVVMPGVIGGIMALLQGGIQTEASGAKAWMSGAGGDVIAGFADGSKQNIKMVDVALKEMKVSMIRGMADSGMILSASGGLVTVGFAKGMSSNLGMVVGSAAQLRIAATKGLGDTYSPGFAIGANLGAGIAAGIRSQVGNIAATAAKAVYAATNAAKAAAEIKSPSRLWEREVGAMMVAGGERGITKNAYRMEMAAASAIPVPSEITNITNSGGDAPMFGSVTFQSTGDLERDVEVLSWEMRKAKRGGI